MIGVVDYPKQKDAKFSYDTANAINYFSFQKGYSYVLGTYNESGKGFAQG